MEWSHSTRIPRDIRGCEEVLSHDSCHEMTPDIRYLESVSNDMRNNQANQNSAEGLRIYQSNQNLLHAVVANKNGQLSGEDEQRTDGEGIVCGSQLAVLEAN
jgi:parallel beta-helix repeat protein